MNKSFLGAILSLGLVASFGARADEPVKYTAHYEICAVDAETGEPMPGVIVTARFPQPPTRWGALSTDEHYAEKTDKNGHCKFKGRCTLPFSDVWIKHKGYYDCQRKVELYEAEKGYEAFTADHAVVTMRVQRVINPIQLQMRDVYPRTNLFVDGKDTIAYDFLSHDFLPPVGTGVVADVVFTRHMNELMPDEVDDEGETVKLYKNRVEVYFPGDGNGIQVVEPLAGSDLKIRTAPEGAYTNRYEVSKYLDQTAHPHQSWKAEPYLCFRIRASQESNGEITGGYYGKIYNGISFSKRERPLLKDVDLKTAERVFDPVGRVQFKYYLNPNHGDRNLEAVGEYHEPNW